MRFGAKTPPGSGLVHNGATLVTAASALGTPTEESGTLAEENCPHGGYASHVLSAAHRNETVAFQAEDRTFTVQIHVSAVFAATPEPDGGRPFNLTGTVHALRGQLDKETYDFVGFVQCDFFTADLWGPKGLHVGLGEPPSRSPRPS